MPIHAFQGYESVVTGTITTAAGAATSYVPAMCPGASLVSAQIVAAWTSGTLVAEGSVDGSTWVALAFVAPLTGAQSASLTPADASTAVYLIPAAGFAKVRVRATAISLGGKAGATVSLNVNPSVPGGASSGLALESGGNLATLATKGSPVAAAAGIVKTAQDATTATTLASNTCVRGFWLYNLPDSAGVLYYAAAAATAPTSAGANAIGFVVPGDRKWFGLSNTNAIKIIASATTTNYAVDLE